MSWDEDLLSQCLAAHVPDHTHDVDGYVDHHSSHGSHSDDYAWVWLFAVGGVLVCVVLVFMSASRTHSYSRVSKTDPAEEFMDLEIASMNPANPALRRRSVRSVRLNM